MFDENKNNDFNIEYTNQKSNNDDCGYTYTWHPYEHEKENVYTPDFVEYKMAEPVKKKVKNPARRQAFFRYVAAGVAGMFAGAIIFGGALMYAGYGKISPGVIEQKSGGTSGASTISTTYMDDGLSVVDVVKKAGPAVVGISTVTTQMTFFGQTESSGSGSGFIIKADGYIVTNQHVIDGAKSVKVILSNGEEHEAKIIGQDVKTDLAVIKIEKTELPVMEVGKSAELEVGELAVAIGNPLGLEFSGSVTQGCISALNRSMNVQGRQYTLIQTDAAINPGNSGGPLVNRFGQVIGINSVKISMSGAEGMGFAIPIDEAMPIINELLTGKGYISGRPLIGVSTRDITEEMSQYYKLPVGVYVIEVSPFSAAEKAGIKAADVIVKADGQTVTNRTELDKIKNKHKAGEQMTLELVRDGQTLSVTITLGEEKPAMNY